MTLSTSRESGEDDSNIDAESVLSSASSDSFSHWFQDAEHPELTVQEEWESIERFLYDEPGPLPANQHIIDECKLWKELFPHFRVRGYKFNMDSTTDEVLIHEEKKEEVDDLEQKILVPYKPNILSIVQSKRDKIKSQVVNHIVKQLHSRFENNPSLSLNRNCGNQKSTKKEMDNKNEYKESEHVCGDDISEKGEVNYGEVLKDAPELREVLFKKVERLNPEMPDYNFEESQYLKSVERIFVQSDLQDNVGKEEHKESKEAPKVKSADKDDRESPYSFLNNYNFERELKPILKNTTKQTESDLKREQTNAELLNSKKNKLKITLTEDSVTNSLEVHDEFKNNSADMSYFERGKFDNTSPSVNKFNNLESKKLPKMNFENNWLGLSKSVGEFDIDQMCELDLNILKKYGKVNKYKIQSSRLTENYEKFLKSENFDWMIGDQKKSSLIKKPNNVGRIHSSKEPSLKKEAPVKHERVTRSSKPMLKNKNLNVNNNVSSKKNGVVGGRKVKLPPITSNVVTVEFDEPVKQNSGQRK